MKESHFAGGIVVAIVLAVGMAACGSGEVTKAIPKSDDCQGAKPGFGSCGVVYFGASKDGIDTELWRSDGTAKGTVQLMDINPTGASDPTGFTAFNGKVYFAADDGKFGVEPWVTDGTLEGTSLVADLNATGSSNPGEFVVLDGRLYFTADSGSGRKLWMTTGEPSVTVPVPSDVAYVDAYSPAVLGSTILFAASRQDTGDTELWIYDGGMSAAIAQDINSADSSYPAYLTAAADKLFFTATDGVVGNELRVWDGHSATVAVNVCSAEIVAPCDGGPSALWAVGSRVYFSAETSGGAASELWMHDGTAGTLVKDIFPGDKALINPVGDVNGRYVFTADDGTGPQLWGSDGTTAGTQPLTTFSGALDVRAAGNTGGVLYVLIHQGSLLQMWRTDGTVAGTARVYRTLNNQGDCSLGTLGVLDNTMLFYANGAGSAVGTLWFSDGTSGGTQVMSEVIVESCGV